MWTYKMQYSDNAIEGAIRAYNYEHIRWSIQPRSDEWLVIHIPNWGDTPVIHGYYWDRDTAFAHMELKRNSAAMRAALEAANALQTSPCKD